MQSSRHSLRGSREEGAAGSRRSKHCLDRRCVVSRDQGSCFKAICLAAAARQLLHFALELCNLQGGRQVLAMPLKSSEATPDGCISLLQRAAICCGKTTQAAGRAESGRLLTARVPCSMGPGRRPPAVHCYSLAPPRRCQAPLRPAGMLRQTGRSMTPSCSRLCTTSSWTGQAASQRRTAARQPHLSSLQSPPGHSRLLARRSPW